MSRAARFAVAAAALALGVCAAARPAHARGCTERSAIVGRQRCGHFGATWSTRDSWIPLWADVSFAVHVVPLAGIAFGNAAANGVPALSLRGEQFGREPEVLFGIAQRSGYTVARYVYAGEEMQVAWGALPGGQSVVSAGPSFDATSVTYLSGAALVGVTGHLGRLGARLELAAGLRNIDVSGTQFYRERFLPAASVDALQFFAAPRAQIDVWLASGFTLGVWAGAEVVVAPSPIGFAGGVALAAHLRPFDQPFGR